MTNEIQIFKFNDRPVRIVEKDGEPWWIAKDVCEILEIENTSDALSVLDADERITLVNSEGNPRAGIPNSFNCVSEPGLYRLIMRSRKPQAKAFQRWVAHDVLPTIRKIGTYKLGDYDIPKTRAEALRLAADLAEENSALKVQMEEDKPYTAIGRACTPAVGETNVGEMAILLSQSLHKRISRADLFDLLRRDEILCSTLSEHNRPRQEYVDKGYLGYRIFRKHTAKGMKITFTPYFTPAGRIFIEKHYLEKGTEI